MNIKNVSTKRIKEYIKDEQMATKDYRKHGAPGLAKDEASHAKFWKRILAKRKK